MESRTPPWRVHLALLALIAVVTQTLDVVVAAPALAGAGPAVDRTLTNGESFPKGFTVPAGETWAFDPSRSVSIEVAGNVVVHGRLEMKPSSKSVVHSLTFTGIDESDFVGAGSVVSHAPTEPVAGDVGLWVLGTGVLDVRGTEKVAWSHTYQTAWKGDEVRRTPTAAGDYASFPTVTATPKPNVFGYKAELLNLTRNVVIQGEPNGRTHILIRSTKPQSIRYATIRHVAPDIPGRGHITGRYGLHFHMMQNASAGSVVEGVVIRDAANHAFVPHASHGITFRDTIAYNTTAEAYWWDESTNDACAGAVDCHASHNILYDRVIAALTGNSPYAKHTTASIQLGAGKNNAIVNSVAVGMQGGGNNNAGYIWPSHDHGVWTFRNNVAHNNAANGVFVWQNTGSLHVVDRLTAYHNQKAGVDHGAYHNPYFFTDTALRANGVAIESHALGKLASGTTHAQRWTNVYTGGTGVLAPQPHNNIGDQTRAVRFTYCDFSKVVFAELGGNGKSKSEAAPGRYDFVECDLTRQDFALAGAANGTVIRVQDGANAYRLTGAGVMTGIPTFATVQLPAPGPPPLPHLQVPTPQMPPLPDGGGTAQFGDTVGSIFAADIAWLAATGITKGCNPPANTRFCPEDRVTRGQMAAFLTRALGLPAGPDRFSDDRGSIFEANINALAAAGITKGCNPPTNDHYCPGAHVTRGEMAAFLVRALDLPPGTKDFRDDDGSVFEKDISALAAAGITIGCNPPRNDEFCPRDDVTRAQMAAFLHRAEDYLE